MTPMPRMFATLLARIAAPALASAMAVATAAGAQAAEPPAAAAACVACHGQNGVSANPAWPNLAGQNAGYLEAQIIAYRDGVRESAIMAPSVAELSDDDAAALATYFSSLQPVASASGDSALVSSGENLSAYCKACHGMQGYPATDLWPVLAGQHAPYLQNQLAMFKSGQRVNGHMQAAVARLGEAEFAALAAYYSQLAP